MPLPEAFDLGNLACCTLIADLNVLFLSNGCMNEEEMEKGLSTIPT